MKEYTIKEAVEILEVSKSTVRRRIKSGKIEAELKPVRTVNSIIYLKMS